MSRTVGRLMLATMGLAMAFGAASAEAKPAGPETAKCGKFKQAGNAARFNACKKQNQANRLAFEQIKNSKFVGTRGDGEAVEETFCANGKYESRSSGSTGTGISKGATWTVGDAVVQAGGKKIVAFVSAPGGFEVALTRNGSQWQIGVASLGRVLYPGNATKTDAAAACAAL